MERDREATLKTYNSSAAALAEYFRGIGSRVEDIEVAFRLAGNPMEPNVLEIGCGDGRDAAEIVAHTSRYIGFDFSDAMINLAKDHVPGTRFEVGDAVDFPYPEDIDIVFAFASLLHVNRDELRTVFQNVAECLNEGGIFFISVKHALEYREIVQQDQFGKRWFYLYNQGLIEELAGEQFQTVYAQNSVKGTTDWLEIALQKK